MKKVLSFIVALGLVALSAQADTTNVVTNAVGQVFQVIVGVNGVTTSIISSGTQPTAGTTLVNGSPNVFLAAKGVATTPSAYDPVKPGDILIGQYPGATSNAMWMAFGASANSWVLIGNAAAP